MRQIFIVNATQVVVSDAHPEGLYSVIPNYPRSFDSRSYPSADGNPNGDEDKMMKRKVTILILLRWGNQNWHNYTF